jgi:hypothetical protein
MGFFLIFSILICLKVLNCGQLMICADFLKIYLVKSVDLFKKYLGLQHPRGGLGGRSKVMLGPILYENFKINILMIFALLMEVVGLEM